MEGTTGEIKLWAGNFAPRNWAFCDGQTMTVSEYPALFSLLGTKYGGDGVTWFKLPDTRGRVLVGCGELQGGSVYPLGITGGTEHVTLTVDQMPAHQHSVMVNQSTANSEYPTNGILAAPVSQFGDITFYLPEDPGEEKILPLQEDVLAESGSAEAHNNMMPYLTLSSIICLKGTYPKNQ